MKKISILILLGMCAPSFGASSAKRVNRRKDRFNKVRADAKKGTGKMMSRAGHLSRAQKNLRALRKAREAIQAMINQKPDPERLKQLQSRLALNVQNEKKVGALIMSLKKGMYNSGDNRRTTVKAPVENLLPVGQGQVKPVKTYAEFASQWEKENNGMTPEFATITAIRQSGEEAGISAAEIEKNIREGLKEAQEDQIRRKRFLKGQTQKELEATEELVAQFEKENEEIQRRNEEIEERKRREERATAEYLAREAAEARKQMESPAPAPTLSQEERDAAATQAEIKKILDEERKEIEERKRREERATAEYLAREAAEDAKNKAEIARIAKEERWTNPYAD